MTVAKSALALGAFASALAIGATASARAATPSARTINDEKLSNCSRYSRAYERVESAKNDLQNLYKAFEETDPVKAKMIEIVTQLNDAETTIRKRTASCPANLQVH